jgi:hypothetical protein
MLTAGQLLPPQDLNAAYYNRNPSLSNSRTGGSGSVLPVAGVPNLFPHLLPPEDVTLTLARKKMGPLFCWTTIVLMKVTVLPSQVV